MSDVPGGPTPPPPPPPPGTPPGPGGFRPRTLGEILSEAFRIYKENAAKLMVIVAVVVVPLSFIGALLAHFVGEPTLHRVKILGQPATIEYSRSFGVTILALLIAENRRGTEALKRSWNLVRGHFWHALVVILIAAILTGIVQGILAAIGGHNWFVRWIFSAIAQILTSPFSALVTVLLYLDLRARKEALTAERLRTELASGM